MSCVVFVVKTYGKVNAFLFAGSGLSFTSRIPTIVEDVFRVFDTDRRLILDNWLLS